MATDERIEKYESKMNKTLESLEKEFVTIRAGRANPHILDKLTVDYYGTPTPLQQVANITVPEARMIQIQPWESSLIKAISKAILASDLGLNPNTDGKLIRLILPELTEERRKELVKDVKKKGEAAKVAVRNIRRDANDMLKKLGIRCIWLPIAAMVLASVIGVSFGVEDLGIGSNLPSLATGIVLILASMIFRYGAALEAKCKC